MKFERILFVSCCIPTDCDFHRNEDEQISLTDMVSLISSNIWIGICLSVMLVNCCFLLIYYQNPRLQRSFKVRTKPLSKVINIISLHGLTFFQSEWQQGPTVSSKWILFTYNIMFFIFFGIYTTLYTRKIFSLQKLMPFDRMDLSTGTIAFCGNEDFFAYLASEYCPVKSDICDVDTCYRKIKYHQHFRGCNILFNELQNGNFTAVVEINAIALKVLQYFPGIGIVRDLVSEYPFSFRSEFDFDFAEIFHAITLKMREIGVIKKLVDTHFGFKRVPEPVLNPVMFALVWHLLAIFGVGIAICLIVCLVENFIFRCKSRTTCRDKIIAAL